MSSSIRIKTIDHIGIPIWNRRVSLPFYRDILGLRVIPSMDDSQNIVSTQTIDGTMVHLIEPSDGENLVEPHIAFEVEDFDSVLVDLQDSGYPGLTEPGTRHDGQRHVFLFDNDQNRLEFNSQRGVPPSNRVVDANGYTSESGTNTEVSSPSRIKIITINHVGLPINDRMECMKMYRDLLNTKIIPHQETGNRLAWAELGDESMVHLIGPPDATTPPGYNPRHVAFEVADLEATLDALEDADVEIDRAPRTRPDGQQCLYIHDPDGNRIEIATRGDHSNTPRTVDENGYTSEDGELL